MSQNNNRHHSGSQSPEREPEHRHQEENEDVHDNLALENAIGDAFKQFGFSGEDPKVEEHPQTSESQNHGNNDDDFFLEQSVSQAFASIGREVQEEHQEPKHEEHQPEEYKESVDHNVKIEEDNSELNLEDVIGNAFKSIADDLSGELSNDQNKTNEDAHQHEIDNSHKSPSPGLQQAPQSPHDEEDTKLEDAIGAAFQSLVEEQKKEESPEQHAAPASPKDKTTDHSDKDEHSFDLAGLVSNVVLQIGNEEAHDIERAIPKDVLHELAAEITNQVQGSEESSRKVEVPLIDDNVLMHFQKEANKEEEKLHDSAISSALANAVRTAIQKETQGHVQHVPESEVEGLEHLQMNEIFQNAFNMAMQNPQELLTSFEGEPELALPPEVKEAAASAKDLTVSTAAAIAALSVKDAITQKESQTDLFDEKDGNKKSLSIAETLAIHRASMNKERDQRQSLQEEKQTARPLNPHLTNILSSLSQHIQSGNQSQNLMLLIRQMTNALMLNKSSLHTSALVQEIVDSLRQNPDAHSFHVVNLKNAKDLLVGGEIDTSQKASVIIDAVLDLLQSTENTPQVLSSLEVPKPEGNDLLDLYNSVFNTLTSFGSVRCKNGILGVKPDTESDEYKERIRIDNRERKKKWREGNIERNKDNDLRARVIKRANVMFGEGSTPEKKAWIEEEFHIRREKRLAKQKKEATKATENQRFTEELMEKSSKNPSALAHDAIFIERLTNSFNLIIEIGAREDPKSIMAATAATVAVVASSYARMMDLHDRKGITNAMTLILNSILDLTVKTGDFSRLSFLVKSDDPQPQTASTDSKDLVSRISALTGGLGDFKGTSALELLRSSQKRLGLEFISSDNKKVKIGEPDLKFLEKEKSSMSRIQSEIDQLRNSITSVTTNSFLTPGLRMPLYKSSSSLIKEENPRPLSKGPLPFISNKIGISGEGPTVGGRSTLKKPGSFQRPAFSKPQSKAKNLGFPPLYSASFELQ